MKYAYIVSLLNCVYFSKKMNGIIKKCINKKNRTEMNIYKKKQAANGNRRKPKNKKKKITNKKRLKMGFQPSSFTLGELTMVTTVELSWLQS